MKKLITSAILMTFGFLIVVVVYIKIKNIILGVDAQIDSSYTTRQLILAFFGESARAYLTTWLYLYHRTDKSSVINSIKFGIICSALIASIWLFLGVEFFGSHDKISFLIDDGIILVLQGLIAGLVLWVIYKNEKPAYNQAVGKKQNDHNAKKVIFYDADLAFVHDHGFNEFARNAAQTVWQLVEDKSEEKLIVDLGCGSGILARELVNKNLKMIGVDNSSAMIEIARQNAPGATFLTASIYDFDIPKCDLVCAIGEGFNYLLDNRPNLNELAKEFAHIHSALKPRGHFVFDILTSDFFKTAHVSSRIFEQKNWTIFLDIEANMEDGLLTRKITLFLKKQEGYVKSKETHKLRLFDKKDIETILLDLGFEITQIQDYNGFKFRPGHIGYICKKI